MFTSDPNFFLMFNRRIGACTLFYCTVSTPPQERFKSCCYPSDFPSPVGMSLTKLSPRIDIKQLNLHRSLLLRLLFRKDLEIQRKDRSEVNQSATLGFIGKGGVI
jgi:hypothetical protein